MRAVHTSSVEKLFVASSFLHDYNCSLPLLRDKETLCVPYLRAFPRRGEFAARLHYRTMQQRWREGRKVKCICASQWESFPLFLEQIWGTSQQLGDTHKLLARAKMPFKQIGYSFCLWRSPDLGMVSVVVVVLLVGATFVLSDLCMIQKNLYSKNKSVDTKKT